MSFLYNFICICAVFISLYVIVFLAVMSATMYVVNYYGWRENTQTEIPNQPTKPDPNLKWFADPSFEDALNSSQITLRQL